MKIKSISVSQRVASVLGAIVLFQASSALAFKFDANVPKNIQDQMTDDLNFMNNLAGSGATNLHQQIFGPVSGASYKKFFEDRIFAIGMNGCGNGNAVACVIPFLNPNKMFITQNYIKFSHPQVARMLVVYHEARHTESQNGNWGHDNCPTPFRDENGQDMKSIWTGASLAGEPACDSSALGSYGSSTILVKNIAKFCTNCTGKVLMDADLYANDQLKRVTNPQAKQQMKTDLGITARVHAQF